ESARALRANPGHYQSRRAGAAVVVPVQHRDREEECRKHSGECERRLGLHQEPYSRRSMSFAAMAPSRTTRTGDVVASTTVEGAITVTWPPSIIRSMPSG